MAIPNVSIVNIPPVPRESVQELSDKYVGQAITQHLAQSIDGEIEYRQRLLENGYCSAEEVHEINNEIDYLNELALSIMKDLTLSRLVRYRPIYG